MTTRRPACESRSGQVGARIDRDETGIRRLAPGWCSRMSNTPWPAGSRPVRKVGHAAQECDGVHDRETPRRPRSMSAREVRELARREQRIQDVPVRAVPSHHEYPVGHGR